MVEAAATEHRSQRTFLLLDSFETVAEPLVQSPINPNAESATAVLAVLMMLLHTPKFRGMWGDPASPASVNPPG